MILAYIRVSTTEQAEDGTTSLAEQTRKCKAIADLRAAGPYDFLCYTDVGISGGTHLKERPEGARLLADVKKGDVVVAAKMDRLFRSASDALSTADTFRKQGIHLVLVDMGVEPVTGNGVAKMFFGMLALVAEFERERIAERMQDGKAAKARAMDGRGHIGGVAPYGYRLVGRRRDSHLQPLESEQQILVRVAELAKQHPPFKKVLRGKAGHIAAIKEKLTAEGLLARNGKPLQYVQIKRILQRVANANA